MSSERYSADALRQALLAAKDPDQAGDDMPDAVAPSFEKVFLDQPLYSPLVATDKAFMQAIRNGSVQFDGHCVACEKETTFKTHRSTGGGAGAPVNWNWMFKPGKFSVNVFCQRDGRHDYIYYFTYDGTNLQKIGQFPSLEDISSHDIQRYSKLLPKSYFAELKRAGGLASHGIGIGSFVYLRRIFERLISDHRQKHESERGTIGDFDALRMDEKIAALKSDLPPALVENKSAYSILSRGIHELDEDTCREYFPILRQAIIAILEQDLARRRQEKEQSDLRRHIAAAANKLSPKSKGSSGDTDNSTG